MAETAGAAEAARFTACLGEVLKHEGGFADHPDDPGGATNMGITRATLARWRGVEPRALPVAAVKALERTEAAEIYRALYWEKCRAGEMPAGLDLALFDFAVNSGPPRAVMALQQVLGVKADGVAGPQTLAAVKALVFREGAGAVAEKLCASRLGFLRRLRTYPTFGRGWSRRVAAIRAAALAAVGPKTVTEVPRPEKRMQPMDVLSGYRTYIVASAMLIAGLCQVLGIDLPNLDGQSAGQLIMQALAIIFLRRGLKTETGKA